MVLLHFELGSMIWMDFVRAVTRRYKDTQIVFSSLWLMPRLLRPFPISVFNMVVSIILMCSVYTLVLSEHYTKSLTVFQII